MDEFQMGKATGLGEKGCFQAGLEAEWQMGEGSMLPVAFVGGDLRGDEE